MTDINQKLDESVPKHQMVPNVSSAFDGFEIPFNEECDFMNFNNFLIEKKSESLYVNAVSNNSKKEIIFWTTENPIRLPNCQN